VARPVCITKNVVLQRVGKVWESSQRFLMRAYSSQATLPSLLTITSFVDLHCKQRRWRKGYQTFQNETKTCAYILPFFCCHNDARTPCLFHCELCKKVRSVSVSFERCMCAPGCFACSACPPKAEESERADKENENRRFSIPLLQSSRKPPGDAARHQP
jgi:hypothetical protein